ncbi:MAG: poly(A) polymerase/tRNA-nucleotidyltransferase [Candidatus Dadabacteria bacterium]|nr:MAG: poly(A) polymerase/tRNA-nucleotidyltransferase [Candidatus Dadabacteria bacterium]
MTSEIQYNFLKDKICMKIFSLLNEKEDTARFVGGCVRDSIIGLKTNDIDIATKLNPEDVVKILGSESIKVVPTGIDHGTVSVFSKDFNFEITTLRSDISTDGRHAEVIFSDSWEEDSLRRDFTINSIYLKQNGELYDPHNGIQNLKDKKIIFIGNPDERINEDYLRILRFFRFNAFYGNNNLKLSSDSIKACTKNKNKIKKLSSERVQNEFFKILNSSNPYFIVSIMRKIEILDLLFEHKVETKIFKKLLLIEKENSFSKNHILRFASLALKNKKINSNNLQMFNFSKKERKELCLLTNQEFEIHNKLNKSDIKKILYSIDRKTLKDMAKLSWALSNNRVTNKNWKNVLSQIDKVAIPIFPLKAKDILDYGLEEGPIIGEILKTVEQDWIDSNFEHNKEDLLFKLKAIINRKKHNK